MSKRKRHPAQRPLYDPPVHVCSVCGARAHFAIGYGKSSPGIWYCFSHYPWPESEA